MPHQASFDEKGNVLFDELHRRGPDMARLQAAMFMDRADLWPIKRKPAHKPVKPLDGQIVLLDERPPCTGDECKKKRERRSKCQKKSRISS